MSKYAENQTRVCKAYVADCYKHLANSLNACNRTDRIILKKSIFDMLDRTKVLLNGKSPVEETSSVVQSNPVQETVNENKEKGI